MSFLPDPQFPSLADLESSLQALALESCFQSESTLVLALGLTYNYCLGGTELPSLSFPIFLSQTTDDLPSDSLQAPK
jgi:hypothetical protein